MTPPTGFDRSESGRLQTLAEVTRTFAMATADSDRLPEVIVRELARVSSGYCALRYATPDLEWLLPAEALHGPDPEALHLIRQVASVHRVRLDETSPLLSAVVRQGQSFFLPSLDLPQLRERVFPGDRKSFDRLGVKSLLLLPLRVDGRSLGVLLVLRREGAPSFDEHDLALADNLASHAALTIANARLLAEERSARERAERAEQALRDAEQALRNAEARFRAITELSHDGVTLTAHDGTIEYESPALRRIVGARDDQPSPVGGMHRVHPDDQPELIMRHQGILREVGEAVTHTFRFRHTEGDWRWMELTSVNLLDHPAVRAVVSNARDVTERHRAEEALRQSEERFRQLAESIREVFWLTDVTKGEMAYVSPAYEHIWGRSCESLYAQPDDWANAIHPDDRARVLHAAHTRQSLGTYDEEYRIVRPDGSIRWIHDRASPVRDADGKVIRVAGVAEDVTVQRQLEAQLRQSQKMEAVGRLAGGLAHDFNNVLSVIMSYSELLLADLAETDRSRDELTEINRAASRGADLTYQLLAFSRRQVLAPRLVTLSEVVRGTERMLHRMIGEDIELVFATSGSHGSCRVDPTQIEQVVMNLVVNARDAMPEGGKLTLEMADVELDAEYAATHLDVVPGPYVLLAVSDTGCGMDRATQARIFEPFFTTKEPGRGTGLGLPTVFGIVTQSGGHLWVYSEPGEGSTFRLYFPRTAKVVERPVEVQPKPPVPRGDETILLAEDDPAVRSVVRGILVRSGYNVLEAGNSDEALALCETHGASVALLLTDVVMPGMSGPSLAQAVTERHPHVRVMFMSGYTESAVTRRALVESGAVFLQKPVTPTALLGKVRTLLDRTAAP